jgi:initiation factor 1A
MVKNITGGSKHKSQARKNVVVRGRTTLRVVEEEGECFAQVEKLLGGSNCHVMCMDQEMRLCHIRGKFRGKGKRDNRLEIGTWVMVGVRDYETVKEGKAGAARFQNCDLLEVYKDVDKDKLRNTVKGEWSAFVSRDNERANLADQDEHAQFDFITEEDQEMDKFILQSTHLLDAKAKTSAEGSEKASSGIVSNSSNSSNIVMGAIGDDESDVSVDDI